MIQFLVDECLSPALLDVAQRFGYNAYHVTRRGWSALEDPQLLARVLAEDLTFVTNNWRDFHALLGRTEVHPGIIVILPNVRRERQVELFTRALDVLHEEDPPADLINTVLEVEEDGSVRIYEYPPES